MTELRVAQDIQRELLRIQVTPGAYLFKQPDFTRPFLPGGSVVIEGQITTLPSGAEVKDGWMTVLAAPNENAPYALIDISDSAEASGIQTNDGNDLWQIPVHLVEAFVDYQTTRSKFRDDRQLIIDALTKPTSYDNASGILAFGIRSMKTKGLIYDILERYDQPENVRNRYPLFIGQTFIITVLEKSIG